MFGVFRNLTFRCAVIFHRSFISLPVPPGFRSSLSSALQQRITSIVSNYETLTKQIEVLPPGSPESIKASKAKTELGVTIELIEKLMERRKEYADVSDMMKNDPDPEMRAEASSDCTKCEQAMESLEKDITRSMIPVDKDDDKNVVLEVRAGTGGLEASLFALEMFEMYHLYAQRSGWRWEQLDMSNTDAGGIRDASASIIGSDVFKRLKHESGVHRVQRVPQTENMGRVHTSTATVAVLPEPNEVDVEIHDRDLLIETMRSGGAGGQSVNKTESAVRLTHVPSGLVVICQDERSQHRNKAKALKVLRSRLYEKKREEERSIRDEARSSQIGTGQRNERIRTYNFPQSRVTDHRINYTSHNLDAVMAAEELDDFIDKLLLQEQQDLLEQMERGEA